MRLSHGAAGPKLFYRVCLLLREGLYGLNAFPQPIRVLSLAVWGDERALSKPQARNHKLFLQKVHGWTIQGPGSSSWGWK